MQLYLDLKPFQKLILLNNHSISFRCPCFPIILFLFCELIFYFLKYFFVLNPTFKISFFSFFKRQINFQACFNLKFFRQYFFSLFCFKEYDYLFFNKSFPTSFLK